MKELWEAIKKWWNEEEEEDVKALDETKVFPFIIDDEPVKVKSVKKKAVKKAVKKTAKKKATKTKE